VVNATSLDDHQNNVMKSFNIICSKYKETKMQGLLSIVLSMLCLALFVYTAKEKILDHERFMIGISNVGLIGDYAEGISWFIPVSECIIAVSILIPETRKTGLWGFMGMMVLFTFYIIAALLWAEKLPCHCGGVIETLSWREHLLFNLGFIGLSGLALYLARKT
jgi:hypothetical protein